MARIFILAKCSDIGGVEKSLIATLENLIEEGNAVDLYFLEWPGPLIEAVPPGVNILSKGKYPDALEEVTIRNCVHYALYRFATRLLRPEWLNLHFRKSYDLAIAYTENGLVPYIVIDRIKADKKILYFHYGSYRQPSERKSKDAEYFAKFNSIVTVSHANAEMILENFPSLKRKITVRPNLLLTEKIKSFASESIDDLRPTAAATVILTVGRLCREKNILLSLQAARILTDKGLNFIWYFIGKGEEEDILRKFVDDNELTEHCKFLGELINPYPYFAACDLYVQASVIESECITVKEAMLFNKPIVATYIPALKETLKNYSNATLTCPVAAALADAIQGHI